MKKYMFKRILFSIFSLVVVIACVMLLVYTATERSVIFQMDDVWNKKSNNERTIYEYVQYQKYGYLEYVDYTSFLKTKYQAALGDAYDKDEQFKADKKAIQNAKTWMDNASVQEFKATYEAKGYQMKYLEPIKYSSGKVKPGGTGYYVAVLEKSVFTRLGDYFSHLITFETTNDVKDEKLTDRYVRVEKDPYSGFYAVVGSGTTHKYLLFVDDHFPFIHQNWMHLNLGVSFTKYRGSEISVVICQPQGDLDVRRTQYPA